MNREKNKQDKPSRFLWVGSVTVIAFFAALVMSYLLVTGGRRHAERSWERYSSSAVIINDDFLRKVLPDHPDATVFRTAYLDFFAAEQPDERQAAEENKNKYVLKGDFNENGKPEVAITGLLSTAPNRGKYSAFILIVEKNGDAYRRLFYFTIEKSVRPNPHVEEIKNLALSTEKPRELTVTFANQSGYFLKIAWDGRKYVVLDDAEGESGI